ncbi:MAG: lytic murein transglycosylase B [Sulfurifustis sp.]
MPVLRRGVRATILGAVGLLLLVLVSADAVAVTVEEYPELGSIIDRLVAEHHFNRTALTKLFAAATVRPEIVAAMERPHETLPWYTYRRLFINDERIRLGVHYWQEHKMVLDRAEREFGVPAELIVAIIGVETRYGMKRGEYPTLDALVTLALAYPRRAQFFRQELTDFLLLARELKVDARTVRGSYAGALGIPQFMPRSYRDYAVDFDQDRRRDLLGSSADAIGSVANFLRRHGWIDGDPVIDPARAEATLYSWPLKAADEPLLRVRDWISHGVFLQRERSRGKPVDDDRRAVLVTFEGETGPLYYLAYDNFYVITRYNRSKNYAMAVYELAQAIRRQYQEPA